MGLTSIEYGWAGFPHAASVDAGFVDLRKHFGVGNGSNMSFEEALSLFEISFANVSL